MAVKKSWMTSLMNLIDGPAKTGKAAKSENESDLPPWIKYVAMLTGVLAAAGGFLAVRSTNLTNDAIYQSNQAILAQTEASDAWAEYEADSIKARIVETQMQASSNLSPEMREALAKSDEELRASQPQSKQLATDKTHLRDDHLAKGMKHLHEKDLLGYASLSIQIGIALASVAAMVRMRAVLALGIISGAVGIAVTAYAFAFGSALIGN
jgi:hypothetical protein